MTDIQTEMSGQLHSELRQRDNRGLGQATERVLAAFFGLHDVVHGATSAKRDKYQGHVFFQADGCNTVQYIEHFLEGGASWPHVLMSREPGDRVIISSSSCWA